MTQYRIGKKEEFEDIIDFANYIFSQNECPHDFKRLLPKLYANGRNCAEYHYLALEQGKIKAMVCALPLEFITPEEVVSAACIGMVSVHPYSRGKGYMKELMQLALADLDAKGCAYVFLGGQRQRYEYFGFEPAGVQLEFAVNKANIKHCLSGIEQTGLTLVPLTEDIYLDQAYEIYEVQPYRMQRSRQDWYDTLCSWSSSPYGILQEGRVIGYFVLRSDGIVTELQCSGRTKTGESSDSTLYPRILKELFQLTKGEEHRFQVSPADTALVDFFLSMAESWRIGNSESYRILNWSTLLKVLLSRKAGYESLPEGSVTVRIDDRTLSIAVKENLPFVSKTTEEPELILTSLEATALFFSTAGEYLLRKYAATLHEDTFHSLRRWFPLPLFTSQNDCC